MDLAAVICFLILYYVRPQEWWGAVASIHFVQICMLTGLGTLFFRSKGVRLADFFRTPHDWAILFYVLWMILTAPDRWNTFKETMNVFIFYIVIVQTLYSVPRMKIFVAWWMALIIAIAALAIVSTLGYDPLGGYPITMTSMKGRLILNLSIFNNPNGLGHSVVPSIPMLFYYFVWKRPVVSRVVGVALMGIPLYCIYLTVSKGSFLCAGVTLFATMAFGRPKKVQVGMAILAFLFGTGALFALPRMNELSKSKSDEAIQGRVQAFKHGYTLLQTTFAGVGKGHWHEQNFMTDFVNVPIPPKVGDTTGQGHFIKKPFHYNKAAHSSYVCTGGELGKPGLYFFLFVLYCNLRTTITAVTETDEEERIRRMLFVLVLSYIVSSWMVDFEYRPTYFMFTAAIAALHRHLLGLNIKPEGEEEEESASEVALEAPVPVWRTPELLPQPALVGMPHTGVTAREMLVVEEEAEPDSAPVPKKKGIGRNNWNRLTLFDFGMGLAITYGVIRFWAYIMNRM